MAKKKTRVRTRKGRFVKAAAPKRRSPPKRRRKSYAAPKRRVAARRRSARRNPRSMIYSPAVELGLSTLAGVVLGVGSDIAPKWSFVPEKMSNGHIIGAILLLGGWQFAKGKWRQRLVAAGLGAAGQSVAREQLAPSVSKLFGASESSDAFPQMNRRVRLIRPHYSAPSAQARALASAGIPV